MIDVYVVADVDVDETPCVAAVYTEKWRAELHAAQTGYFVIEAPLLIGDNDSDGENL